VERLLRRELEQIARDRRSGAAELALRAAHALTTRLRRSPRFTRSEAMAIARALIAAQPEMAPFLRLGNEVATAAESADAARELEQTLRPFVRGLRRAPHAIGRLLRNALRPRAIVATYSYSSTVVQALRYARGKIRRVYCSESRPGGEGRAMAARLSRAGLRVTFLSDAALFALPPVENYVILGADRITPHGFVNKIGSELLAARGQLTRRAPVLWLVVDTSKFLPAKLERLVVERPAPAGELWGNPPRGVCVENAYFTFTPFSPKMRILTERGWMTPREARRTAQRIRAAPLLLRLAARSR